MNKLYMFPTFLTAILNPKTKDKKPLLFYTQLSEFMKKNYSIFILTCFLFFGGNVLGQGTENFSNIPTGSSTNYNTRSWTGTDGVTWGATLARTDQTMTGKAICTNGNGTVTSPSYSGGMGTLTFNYVRAFTGTGTRTIQVWVNGSKIGSDITVSTSSDAVQNYSGSIL